MAQSCPEGKYLDRLLRECVSCTVVCHDPVILTRCSEYCMAWRCKAVSGQFYDTLLKKCLRCSELCGSHPSACSHVCKSTNAAAMTQRPNGVTAVQLITSRGRPGARAELESEVLLYSLLGLCIAVLMCTLTAAILVLLKRAKGHQEAEDGKNQRTNKLGQSSEDSLMARADDVSQEGNVNQDRPKATETCVYCFSDHTRAPHTIYQQAGPQNSSYADQNNHHHDNGLVNHPANAHYNHHHDNGLVNHPANAHYDKTRSFRIICSPTQTSM